MVNLYCIKTHFSVHKSSQTCEKFAVLLLYFLRTLKLLLGMFLRHFVSQINWIFLLPANNQTKRKNINNLPN